MLRSVQLFWILVLIVVVSPCTSRAAELTPSPVGAYRFDDGSILSIGEQDGRMVAVFPDGRIRGLTASTSFHFNYGATLGDTRTVHGSFRLAPAAVSSEAVPNIKSLIWHDATHPVKTATRITHREINAAFANRDTALSGTLFMPVGAGPFGVVVMTHGSGQETRNRSALVFALVAQGIGVLSFDKRGTGQSTGTWRAAFSAYAGDMVAAIDWLRIRPDIDVKKIGVWGHSQGAWIAPLAATLSPHVAFVIAQAGGGVNPVLQDLFHAENILRTKTKYNDAQIAEVSVFRRMKFDLVSGKIDRPVYEAALNIARTKEWFRSVGDGLPNAEFWAPNADYDPATTLAKLTCPTLFILGDLDAYGPTAVMKQNIDNVFAMTSRPFQQAVVLKNANHALFASGSLALLESSMQTTDRLADGYQSLLFSWVRDRVK